MSVVPLDPEMVLVLGRAAMNPAGTVSEGLIPSRSGVLAGQNSAWGGRGAQELHPINPARRNAGIEETPTYAYRPVGTKAHPLHSSTSFEQKRCSVEQDMPCVRPIPRLPPTMSHEQPGFEEAP